MRQLTQDEADHYIDAADIEFIHTVQQCASIHIGRNAEGLKFVLLMDDTGHVVITEGM